ncbi:metallophosphoesterase : Metallophosphoesterase OS=Myxococcus fulvus (strain ATCC BAA-855 / HW-1) GN=LILAB_12425 PE=4 SV=1: AAA_33: Metallophos [Gemmataceae bacterium]|nr:metallophosphoesterase : Metallophosphoesterase OS=Myxococcus fulvus (strain ATCC BAA-855 / HW-1) GN=LILAB_12425 PE=4 SV=1: AAA_33: Metallophos [Gemmataceae bacterium]VTU00324.1 metallophosphoesterase : Metallophosphoesterase OS=Myxococcus fulvus (strain ATCC BAA-855 / HW-1) GN=LILAB_12425 PE=4 SV=1: AAA_33: Metallophos [Gemmataceae bacterium]
MAVHVPEFALVMLVGPSGSGKSSFARKHFKGTEVLSSDFFRGMLSDDESNQAVSGHAFEVLHLVCEKRLAAGRFTVIDATNVRAEARKPLVELARKYHAQLVALVFDFPPEVCHARNQLRAAERSFGPHVTRNHAAELARSLGRLEDEGFRRVFVFRSEDEVNAAEIVRYPLPVNKRYDHGPFDVIGDVHGCLPELLALLEKLGYTVRKTETGYDVGHLAGRKPVFVGDLCDRGPDTPGVFRVVMDLVQRGAAYCVLGNHDDKLLRWLKGTPTKLTHGLAESVAQFEREPPEFRDRVAEFLTKLPTHLVLDGGKLVVAHAGLPAEMHGRVSGKVRAFALYGDTTGESDEFGLPVRLNWAANYRGRATVVYGHTPTLTPAWENRCICIDTGCVFGGRLTALRYPDPELVSVPAEREYAVSKRPLASPGGGDRASGIGKSEPAASPTGASSSTPDPRHPTPDVLDLADVAGRRTIDTAFAGKVTVREENAAAALEVVSRFAADPRWLVYLPPTMSPVEASPLPDFLEHPAEAFDYFRREGVERVVCEQKHMGSRAVVIVCRDAAAAHRRFGVSGETGIVYTRTGRRFFDAPATEATFLDLVRTALTERDWWAKFGTDWFAFDGELMPWSAKAQELLRRQYAASGSAATAALREVTTVLASRAGHGTGAEPDLHSRFAAKLDNAERFVAAYRGYCWPVESVADLRFAPFFLLATEGKLYFDRTHEWHMQTLADLASSPSPLAGEGGRESSSGRVRGEANGEVVVYPSPGGEAPPPSPSRGEGKSLLVATPFRVVELAEAPQVDAATRWWLDLTAAGGEGMVVKPFDVLSQGKRFFAQPALKVRGREYLRIIYGPDYLLPENLSRLKHRAVGSKRGLAAREFGLGLEGLERFTKGTGLRGVHECAFAVLALESEPIDPRL